MKTPIRFATVLLAISLSSCTSLQPKWDAEVTKVKAWWVKPSTQQKVQVAGEALGQFLLTVGLGAAESALTGQKLDQTEWTKIGLTSLATTISTQGPAIRQLQGTSLILDPDATALALQQSGTPQQAAKVIGLQVVSQIKTQMADGLSANQASENVAQSLDTASAIGALGVTP